jgi:ferredoxin
MVPERSPMPYCPACHAEFRPELTRCSSCNEALVEALPQEDETKAERLRQATAIGEAAVISRTSYTEACQMVEQLQRAGLDAMVTGDASCGKSGSCASFMVAVLKEDAAAAVQRLRSEWRTLVETDADCKHVDPDAAVDFDAEGAHVCPACGGAFEGAPQECPECGLFLGVV